MRAADAATQRVACNKDIIQRNVGRVESGHSAGGDVFLVSLQSDSRRRPMISAVCCGLLEKEVYVLGGKLLLSLRSAGGLILCGERVIA